MNNLIKDSGLWAKLEIPSVIDRLMQQAIVQVLTPTHEEIFSNYSDLIVVVNK